MNQNKEESTVIDDHMNQRKAIRSLSFRKLPSQGDPCGEEKEDENRQIGMEARGKKFTPQMEKKPKPNKKADPEKDIKAFSPSNMPLPWEI